MAVLEAARGGRADAHRSLEQSQQAVHSGSAALADYRRVLGDQVEQRRAQLVAFAPVAAACRIAGMRWEDGLGHLVGYPPDTELPIDLGRWLDYYADVLTTPVPTNAAVRRQDDADRRFVSGDRALGAALTLFAIGDAQGLQLRHQIWDREDEQWRLSEDALNSAEEHLVSLEQARRICGQTNIFAVALQRGAMQVTDVPTRRGSHLMISYAEMARVVAASVQVGGRLTAPT